MQPSLFSVPGFVRAWRAWLLLATLISTAPAQNGNAAEASCDAADESPRCASDAAKTSLRWRGFPYFVSNPKHARTIYGGEYISATFRKNGFEGSVDDHEWDVLWTHRPQYHGLAGITLPSRPGLRLANHCNYFSGAGNKCLLARHVQRVKEHLQKDDVRPEGARHLRTFDLSNKEHLVAWQNLVRRKPAQDWILKPCLGGASKGIEVLHGQALIDAHSSGGFPSDTVAQEYVERPFMKFGGSKFHLRLYVLVTQWAPATVYLYDNGLVFRSRHAYQHDSARSAARDAFSSISDSVEVLPLSELWAHLDSLAYAASTSSERTLDAEKVRGRVNEVLAETLGNRVLESFGDYQAIEKDRGFSCFDLFGVDVILDEDLWPFIMEINLGPDLWVSHRGGENVGKQEAVKAPLIQQVVHWASLRVRAGDASPASLASALDSAREAERASLMNFTRLL